MRNIIALFLRLIFSPIGWMIYALSFFIKKNKKIWIFCGSRSSFIDNSKYAFLLSDNSIRKVWITQSKSTLTTLKNLGFETYLSHSWRYAWIGLRAQYFIYDAYILRWCLFLSGGAKRVNLWHGNGVKVIEADIKNKKQYLNRYHNKPKVIQKRILTPEVNMRPNILLAANKHQEKILVNAFRAFKAKTLIAEFPRTMIWCLPDSDLMKLLKSLNDNHLIDLIEKCKTHQSVYAYCPTFRDLYEFDYDDVIKPEAMNRVLKDRDELLIVKLHPNVTPPLCETYSNIIYMAPQSDIYPILPYVDTLISDYSSIVFDFFILNRPVAFAVPDLNQYLSMGRDMYYDFERDILCGPRIDTLPEIFDADINHPEFHEKRKHLEKLFLPEPNMPSILDQMLDM